MTQKLIWLAAFLLGFAGIADAQTVVTLNSETTMINSENAPDAGSPTTVEFRTVDEEVRAIKDDVLALSAELFVLEEALLYPGDSQVAFFVSMDVGEYFDLESVSLQIDGTEVANYLYSEREVGALARGGVQRLHIENLNTGEHELVAVLFGESDQLKNYRSDISLDIEKGIGSKYVELEITDRVTRQQPEFVVNQWE